MRTASANKISKKKNIFFLQEVFNEKTKDFTIFQKIMLTSYTLMTAFFLFAAIFFVLTKGFKY